MMLTVTDTDGQTDGWTDSDIWLLRVSVLACSDADIVSLSTLFTRSRYLLSVNTSRRMCLFVFLSLSVCFCLSLSVCAVCTLHAGLFIVHSVWTQKRVRNGHERRHHCCSCCC